MKILSLLFSRFHFDIFLWRWHLSTDIIWSDWIMSNNFIIFYMSSIVSLSFFNIIMLLLGSLEALNEMIFQCALHTCLIWYRLDKSNHCFITLRIKLFIRTRFYLRKFPSARPLCILERVFAHFWLNIVPEIGNESHAVIKFNVECLIIYWCPFSWNDFSWAFSSVLTKYSFAFIIFHNVQSVNVFRFKCKLIISIN